MMALTWTCPQAFFYHPTEQRHIVRLLFMPVICASNVYSTPSCYAFGLWHSSASCTDTLLPADAVCSFLSYFFYRQALYFQLVRDCYEALVIASFFFLLLSYLSNPPPSPETPIPKPYATKRERDARLRASVRDLHLNKWMWPLGRWKWRPAGGGPGEGEVRFSLLLLFLNSDPQTVAGFSLVDARLHRPVCPRSAAVNSRIRHRRSDRLLLPRVLVAQVRAHLVIGGDLRPCHSRHVVCPVFELDGRWGLTSLGAAASSSCTCR